MLSMIGKLAITPLAPMLCINNFQKNVLLAPYTTFRIGGPAKYFFVIKNSQDLIKAVDFAKKENLPFFILGGGSNLLISDKGFNGLVIKTENRNYSIKGNRIISEAGARLSDLVNFSVENSLAGLEWAIGIPGTIGGAVKVNASCFGGEMKNLVKKTEKKDNIILSVELELEKGKQKESRKLIKEIIKKRKQTQPIGEFCPGCIFKNTKIAESEAKAEKLIPRDIVCWDNTVPAGRLIDQAGLKGKKIGGAVVSQKHANFIINSNNAKAKDVIKLIDLIKETIKEKYQIELEEEIEYLGF